MKTRNRHERVIPANLAKVELETGKKRNYRSQAGKRYYKWSSSKMVEALNALRNKEMGLNKAAKMYSVPKATLKRHLEGTNRFASEGKKILGSQKSIPTEIENELKQRVEDTPSGMTGIDLRKLVYEIAEAKGIPHKFSREKKMAGRHWFHDFVQRNPDIIVRRINPSMLTLAVQLEKKDSMTPATNGSNAIERNVIQDMSVECLQESNSEFYGEDDQNTSVEKMLDF